MDESSTFNRLAVLSSCSLSDADFTPIRRTVYCSIWIKSYKIDSLGPYFIHNFLVDETKSETDIKLKGSSIKSTFWFV